MSQEEFLAGLFRFATGWLCWPPATAYAATLDELVLAREGRFEQLEAVFGKKKTEERPKRWTRVKPGTMTAFLTRMASGPH